MRCGEANMNEAQSVSTTKQEHCIIRVLKPEYITGVEINRLVSAQ